MSYSTMAYELSGGPAHGYVVTFSKRVIAIGVVFTSDDARQEPCGRLAIYRPSPTTCGLDLAAFDCVRDVPAVGPALRLDARCFLNRKTADHRDAGRILIPDEVQQSRRAAVSWPALGRYAGTVGHVRRSPVLEVPEVTIKSVRSRPCEDTP